MIYGNPLIFGSSGGGSGPSASDAILTVTVPTGSTVTMTKGGVTLTPTMWVQAADNTLDCALFVIGPSLFDAQNAWTVTATLGTDTASDTVTISANEQYDMLLEYNFYLFKSGYGAVVPLTYGGQQNATVRVETNEIVVSSPSTTYVDLWLNNTNAIDLSLYGRLVVVATITDRSTANDFGGILFAANTLTDSSIVNTNNRFVAKTLISQGSAEQTTSLDISNININGYVGIKGKMTGTIKQIYLELR